jgi:uncharacterized protein (TIGR00730 family)
MSRGIGRVCVFCASSSLAGSEYMACAQRLGALLARKGVTVVYGGGAIGLMGALADSAIVEGGRVIGIIPRFMQELEWAHGGLTELRVVDGMHERKRLLVENADAVVALPGGCGTLEELLEVITLKRLAIYLNPIVLVNVGGYFDPLLQLFEKAISERFMDARHRAMWTVVDSAEEVLPAIERAAVWPADARRFAAL